MNASTPRTTTFHDAVVRECIRELHTLEERIAVGSKPMMRMRAGLT